MTLSTPREPRALAVAAGSVVPPSCSRTGTCQKLVHQPAASASAPSQPFCEHDRATEHLAGRGVGAEFDGGVAVEAHACVAVVGHRVGAGGRVGDGGASAEGVSDCCGGGVSVGAETRKTSS